MIRDITIGQYYHANSVIHRLDPRVKLFGTIVFIVSLFLSLKLEVYILAALFLIIAIIVSKVPFKFMIKGLKPIVFLLIMTFLFNLFLTPGEEVFKIWRLNITKEGINLSVLICIRFILLILGSSVMTLTTTPNILTSGISKALKFLKVVKFPVDEVAMMMSIALRFIPILVEETGIIMKAQEARGASFNEGSIVKRAKALLPILVPLFVSAFRRADELAMAMESRCYFCGKPRTEMKPLKYKRCDVSAYIIILIYLGLMIVASILLKKYHLLPYI